MAGLALASFALCQWWMAQHPASAFYMMPARAWQFALGALVWLCLPASPRAEKLWRVAGWLGLIFIGCAGLGFDTQAPYPGLRALLPSLGAALVIAAGQHSNGVMSPLSVSALLSLRPLQWLGHLSYSWYLWHWPMLLLGGAIYVNSGGLARFVFVLLSLLLAACSYRYVELPIRRNETLLRHPCRMIAGTLALLLLVSGLGLGWRQLAEKHRAAQYARIEQASMDRSALYAPGASCDTWFFSAKVTVCTYGDKNAQHTAVLMGDSIGAQWFPALEPWFTQSGWRLLVITKSACPMVEKSFFYPKIGKEYAVCTEWRQQALEFLQKTKPDHVFLGSANSSGYGFSPEDWQEGTQKILSALSPHVGVITLIRGTPALPFDMLECLGGNMPLTQWLSGTARCQASPDQTQNDQIFHALRKAAKPFPNVRVLDMNEVVCPDGRCWAEREGVIVFRDSQHLTASFVAQQTEVFADSLEALWRDPETADASQ
jgi:hypothetical protein